MEIFTIKIFNTKDFQLKRQNLPEWKGNILIIHSILLCLFSLGSETLPFSLLLWLFLLHFASFWYSKEGNSIVSANLLRNLSIRFFGAYSIQSISFIRSPRFSMLTVLKVPCLRYYLFVISPKLVYLWVVASLKWELTC